MLCFPCLYLRLPVPLDQASDYDHQLDRLYRFGDVHLEAGVERARAVFDAAEGRQRNGGQHAVARLFPSRRLWIRLKPSSPGMARSQTSTSGRRSEVNISSASPAEANAVTRAPCDSNTEVINSRALASSSTTAAQTPSSDLVLTPASGEHSVSAV